MLIEVNNLSKQYENGDIDTLALNNVSFGIEQGEFVAIIGPSGSGKSTLMHILGALDIPTSGTYVLDGRDVSQMSEDELSDLRREKIGFVFQAFNLLPRTSVLKNVMLPLLYSGLSLVQRREMAYRSLAAAGLEESKYHNHSNQLSGGQIQRVAIARALINNPAIILADEPTGNLDTKTSHVVMAAFQKLHREGHTIIIITHEPEIAEFAERIISIRDGQIEKDSSR